MHVPTRNILFAFRTLAFNLRNFFVGKFNSYRIEM